MKTIIAGDIGMLEAYHGKRYSSLQTTRHCFHSVKNALSETVDIRPGRERRSRIEIPPICGKPRGPKLFCHSTAFACAVFLSSSCCVDNGWPQTHLFFIALDCIGITTVHNELYMLHQESRTHADESS